MRPDDQELDHLLAKGRLSGAEKERILDNVLAAHARPSFWRRLVQPSGPVFRVLVGSAAALALIVVLLPRPTGNPSGFQAKGDDASTTAFVEAACAGPCRSGSTLVFRVSGLQVPAYLAAWAEPVGESRIWYFPGDDSELPRVEPTISPSMLPRGVKLGVEHPPGSLTLHLVLVRRTMSRQTLLAVDAADPDLVVEVVQKLEISP